MGCGPQEQFYGCSDIAIGNKTLPEDVTLPYWRDEYDKYTTTPNWEVFTNPPKPKTKLKPIIIQKPSLPKPKYVTSKPLDKKTFFLKKLINLLRKYPKIDIKELVEVQLKNKLLANGDTEFIMEGPTKDPILWEEEKRKKEKQSVTAGTSSMTCRHTGPYRWTTAILTTGLSILIRYIHEQ